MPDTRKCPGEDTLLAFLNGTQKTRRSRVEHHLMRCAACQEIATWAATDVATLRGKHAKLLDAAMELPSGARVDRYQILGRIGRGGMGDVYAAYHPDLDRRIALKIVHGELAADPARQARLLREARIIARLSHPNIVAVYDAGTVGGQVYLAMELVDGQTLDVWVREKKRRWREIIDVFLAAGRGLAGAHAANVIHRDFKPQNVMIGRDGRVRVMDFGLARPVLEAPEPAPNSSEATIPRGLTSTTVGALVGTPAYMAPEQLRGETIDLRADQFSFCVALREAMSGRFPRRINAVLRKGLAHDRSRRYASMALLLRAMERGRARLSGALVLFGVAASLTVTVGLATRAPKLRQVSCSPPRGRLEAVWGPVESPSSKRAQVHQLFRSSGLTGADVIWERVAGVLDARAHDWAAMYQDACEATHVRGDQSAEVLDLRMTCLADTLDETRAYADGLLTSKGAVIEHALSSVSGLGPIQQCADVKNIRLQFPLPQDPRTRANVVLLQRRMNDADVLASLRDTAAAQRELDAIVPAARQLNFKPLVAQVLEKRSHIDEDLYRFAEGERIAEEALAVAEESHDDLTAVKAAETLGYAATTAGRFDDGRRWLRFADAVINRIHAQGSLVEAWLLNDWSLLYLYQGDLVAAERAQREAVALKTRLLGPRDPDVAITLCNLAMTLDEMDRSQEAHEVIRSALSITKQYALGPSEIIVEYLLVDGETLTHVGRLDEAEVALRWAFRQAQNGPKNDAIMANAVLDLADLSVVRHRPAEAIELITKVQNMMKGLDVHIPVWNAAVQFALARALVDAKRATRRTNDMVVNACAAFGRLHYVRRERELLRWFNGLAGRADKPPATSCSDLARARPAVQLPHQ